MNVIYTLRTYLGLSQAKLAKMANITQPDLSEMETKPPYGFPDKYQRLSKALGIPVDALLKDDFTLIPVSFFDKHSPVEYLPAPTANELLMARQGEELVLRRERERLARSWPALSRLVLPCYKMKGPSPGYDILSFDDNGRPILLEVKTSTNRTNSFRFTCHELEQARRLTGQGEQYVIVYISCWGTEDQTVRDIPYAELERTHKISPYNYVCRPNPKKEPPSLISGLAYFRQVRCLRQAELAEALGVNQYELSLYENRQRTPMIPVFLKASELLDATVEDLLADYPVPPREEAG